MQKSGWESISAGNEELWECYGNQGNHFIDRVGKKRYNQQYSEQIYVTVENNLKIALRRLYYVSRP